jgi:DNA repair protein RadC
MANEPSEFSEPMHIGSGEDCAWRSPGRPGGKVGPVADEHTSISLMKLISPALDNDLIAAMHTAQALLARFGSLNAVMAASEVRLMSAENVSPRVARAISTAGEVMRLVLRQELRARPVIDSFTAMEAYLAASMRGLGHERVIALFLDIKNGLIADVVMGEGTVHHCPLYPRMVVEQALHHGAAALILVHNHPSGDPTPSRADLEMTSRLASALATVDIALHDHVIVGRSGLLSMRAAHAW